MTRTCRAVRQSLGDGRAPVFLIKRQSGCQYIPVSGVTRRERVQDRTKRACALTQVSRRWRTVHLKLLKDVVLFQGEVV